MLGLLIALTSLALAQVVPDQEVEAIELLRQPRFERGVRVATRSNYPRDLQAQAQARWEKVLPATATSSWEFIEIAETQNLADNPDTPELTGGRIIYASRDRSKRFEITPNQGAVHFVIDTEREWRHGCNLAEPQDGIEPRFCRGKAWNWPHFLVSQAIRDPRRPDGLVTLGQYQALVLHFSAELVACSIGRPNPCPPGAWGDQEVPNHCLFYAAVVLRHKDPQASPPDGPPAARQVFALHPVFCSWDGMTHSSPEPWLGLDPANHAVYWAANLQGLQIGRPSGVSIDVQALATEALAAINQRFGATLSPPEFVIDELLLGWEIWGPFQCDIALRDLSLRAVPK